MSELVDYSPSLHAQRNDMQPRPAITQLCWAVNSTICYAHGDQRSSIHLLAHFTPGEFTPVPGMRCLWAWGRAGSWIHQGKKWRWLGFHACGSHGMIVHLLLESLCLLPSIHNGLWICGLHGFKAKSSQQLKILRILK